MDLNTHRKHTQNSTIVPRHAEQPRRISVKEKEGKNTLLLPTPASHFGLQRFQAARGRVSAVFREMTCLCTSCSVRQRGCLPRSGAAPFLVNSSFPGLALQEPATQGASCWAAGTHPTRSSFSKVAAPPERPAYPFLSLRRFYSQTDCHETQHAEASGALWAKTGSSLGTA